MSAIHDEKKNCSGLVSIVTPIYNSEKYITKYLESIRAQEYSNIELILVNDGSTDKTEDIIDAARKSLEETGITVILIRQANSGAAAAVKAGLSVASGEFLIWPDSDDILLPGSIARRVKALKEFDVDVVVSDSYLSDNCETYLPTGFKFVPSPMSGRVARVLGVINRSFPAQSVGVMVRKEAVDRLELIKNYYVSSEGQNLQLYIPLLYHLKWVKLNEVLQVILVHSSSHSRKKRTLSMSLARVKEIRNIVRETVNATGNIDPEDASAFLSENRKTYYFDVLQLFLGKVGLSLIFRGLKKFS